MHERGERLPPLRAVDGAPDVPRLSADECQVWWATPRHRLAWHDGLLDGAEHARRDRLRRAGDRDRFSVAVALTRIVLGAHLGVAPTQVSIDRTCPRCDLPHGKPRLMGSPPAVEFSISHSADRIAVAMAAGGTAVGVDVEELARSEDVAELSRLVLSSPELAELARFDPKEHGAVLLRYWTRKEAIVKATGDGLNEPLTNLTVTPPDQDPRLLDWATRSDAPRRFALHDLNPGTGYVASLAVVDGPVAVSEIDAGRVLTGPGSGLDVAGEP